ncbi:MAG: GGDEF domain-containing protein [Deltaproteobacteria bacterium]|nr:GGDEF domain-containing protein [Deltaproteobacteria bacterium]
MKGTIRSFYERYPRRWSYPVAGLVLALGAPIGFFVVRALFAGHIPSPMWIEVELRERFDAYVYLTFATAIVFSWAGRVVGVEQDRVRADSLTDPLTSLPNRRFAQERAEALLLRGDPRVSVLLIDLDGLKQINEKHGHDGGDRALCAVAATLRKVCRREDVFARYGGDEFIVLLPKMVAADAMRVAERVCATMTKTAQTNGLGPLSVSIGVADTETAATNTLLGLVQAADAALQAAKHEGKNRAKLARSLHKAAGKGAVS